MISWFLSSSPLYVSLIFILFIFIKIPLSLCDEDLYSSCGNKFNCGIINNVSFPFWGENRPNGCGYPGLKLNCDQSVATIEIKNVEYLVLDVNPSTQILKIRRKDYLNGICSPKFVNTTLDPTLFDFGLGYQNLTIAYGCAWLASDCPMNVNLELGAHGPGNCTESVVVPVPSSFQLVNISKTFVKLDQVIGEGFEVKWKVDTAACSECMGSKGDCGYDLKLNRPTCYNSQAKPDSSNKKEGVSSVQLGLFISGGAIAGILLGGWVFFIIQRKKSRAIESQSKYVKAFIMNHGSFAPKRYTYSEIKKMTNSFKEKLGQGGYGSVYKGKLLDGRLVAVKVINELKGSGEEFINEVASISRTSHVNIVTLLGYSYETTKKALVYEFMPNGSLDKFIYNHEPSSTNCQLEREKLFQIVVGIARGLEYLHRGCSTRILHFDIKPQNILLDEDFCPKISDFGLARLCQMKESIVSMLGTRGTIGYIAPEVFNRNFGRVSYKADVYSYGMLVLEMVGRRKNSNVVMSHSSEKYFPHWIYQELNLNVNAGNNMDMTEEGEEMERKMILVSLWCIQTVPTDRPSMTKVVEMLEGGLQSIEIPPKPFLSSPKRSIQNSSTTSLS